MYKIVEKNNHNAVHAHCGTIDSAQRWLAVDAVKGCEMGYFMDKTLTPSSFIVIDFDYGKTKIYSRRK